MFSEDFLSKLPDDPIVAAHAMCEFFMSTDGRELEYKDYIEAYAAFEAFCEASGLSFGKVKLENDRAGMREEIVGYFTAAAAQLDTDVVACELRAAREKYRLRFGVGLLYEFSEGDLARIQTLINELRDLAVRSESFDANHRERFLKRLEQVQAELHKKIGTLDKVWAFIGEAGVVIGKFGTDAKPFVDRIREILQIAWRTQARAEELPSGAPLPLLEDKTKDE